MDAFGSSGGLRERRFSLKSTLSRVILQGARFITYAHLTLQSALFAYRTRFRFRYADPKYGLFKASALCLHAWQLSLHHRGSHLGSLLRDPGSHSMLVHVWHTDLSAQDLYGAALRAVRDLCAFDSSAHRKRSSQW
jgi:hypothetical protein